MPKVMFIALESHPKIFAVCPCDAPFMYLKRFDRDFLARFEIYSLECGACFRKHRIKQSLDNRLIHE